MSLDPFNPTREQERVVSHAGSAFIAACPGAGKTRVLVERSRYLLKDSSTGKGIAFLSFTNAAVSELENRLRQEGLLPSPAFPHFIGTFDSFLWQFLVAPFPMPQCVEPPRLIPDKDERTVRPFDNARDLPLDCFDRITGDVVALRARRYGFDPLAKTALTKAYVTAARKTRERFLARGELDFTDARIIANGRIKDPNMSVRLSAALAARFREVIVDEAQDCNPADLEIIGWLRDAGIVTKVICDPHQSIYEFRGGVTEQLFEFGKTFVDGQLPMSGNFRSSEHVCKVIVSLRAKEERTPVDQALGEHRNEPTPVHILSYPGKGVPASVGTTFAQLVSALKIDLAGCPVLAATRESAAKAIGQPIDAKTRDLTLCLAMAVTGFHFSLEMGNRKAALEEIHRVVLAIEGGMGPKTYHQHLAAEGINADAWRPRVIQLARDLRFEPAIYPNADAWLLQARALLAPRVPADKGTIAQRLRRNTDLAGALAIPSASGPAARTIHAVKGMEFPAVCVVMTIRTAKGILDYLEDGGFSEHSEDARKIYVAASRAQRLLVIAAPKKQAGRLATHIGNTGARVTLMNV